MGSPAVTVSIVADTAQLKAQLAEATATLKSTTTAFAEAQQVIAAQGVGTEQAAKIMAGYRAEMAAAEANVAALKSQLDGLASTETRATTSMRGLAAATGLAGRELGGGMGAALGRVVAQTGLFGGAIEALMPAVLGFAAVDVFGHMIEQAVDAYNNFISLDAVDQKLFEDVQKLSRADFINVHSIETATVRLKEATEYATTLRELSDQVHGSGWSQIFSGDIAGGAGNLAAAHAMRQQSSEDQKQSIALETHKIELQHQNNLLQIEANHAADGGLEGQAKINAELAKKLALNKEDQEYTRQRDRLAGNAVPANAGDSDRSLKDAIAIGQARGQELEQARENYRKMLEFDRSSEELVDREAKKELEAYTKLNELKRHADAAGANLKPDDLPAKEGDEYVRKQIAIWDAQTRGFEIQQQQNAAIHEAQIRYQQATGAITPLVAAYAMAAEHARQYREQLEGLNDLLKEQQARGNTGGAADTQNQITALQGKQTTVGLADQTNIQKSLVDPYIQGFNQISDAWMQVQNKMIMGGRGAWMAIREGEAHMVLSVIDGLERIAIKSLESEVKRVIAHEIANQQKVTSDAGAAAASQTINAKTAFQEITQDAAAAAAATYKALAGIPIIGPVLAPVAAAGAYAGVIALAAFDEGTSYVPKDGVAMIHKGEYIMPAAQSEILREALSGRGSAGPQSGPGKGSIGTVNLHYQGGRSAGPEEMMSQFGKWARRANLTTRT